MAEEAEPRRSGRATKGQYTKDRDIDEAAPKRKGGKVKGPKNKAVEEVEEEAPEELIRCICGQYEEEEEQERDMICCDKCLAWQHNDCMLLPYTTADAPDQYFCEQCHPEDHKTLLDAIARGEKPWEEVAKRREEARRVKKKKGGKRGRKSGGRQSEIPSEVSQERESSQKAAKESPAVTGQKRKIDDTSTEPVDTKKARSASAKAISPATAKDSPDPKPSGPAVISQSPMVKSPEELSNKGRKSAASALVKLFTEQAKAAQKAGSFSPPEGKTPSTVSNELGVAVEHAMFASLVGSGDLNEAYKTQLRAILHNIKTNASLRDRLLSGALPPHALAVMSAEDMASEEQQQRDAAIKAEAEKQAVLIQDEGPRIRRTHKGDEFVDEADQVAAEPPAPTRRESQLGETAEARSPTQASPTDAEKHLFSPTSRKPPSINTQVRRSSGAPERKSSSNFNIQEVWSSVGSPDHDQQFPPVSHRPVVPPPGPGAQPDAEIDELLKDEDNESEPYSPKDVTQDPEIVWSGRLDMEPIAGFRGFAKFTAGADAQSLGLTWDNLLPSSISINGRIDTKRADTYLCGLRYSNTTDVVCVSIRAPDHPGERESFDKLFTYFKDRDRYGVVAKHALPAVKDTYIIPIEAGATNEQKPEFLQLLDNDNIESPNPDRLLLIVFVVRWSDLSHTAGNHQTSQPVGVTPLPPTMSQTPSSQQGTPYPGFNGQSTAHQQYSPTTPQQGMPPNGSAYSPPPPSQGAPQVPSSVVAAHQFLPPEMFNAPAVQQLLYQAPAAGAAEMDVIKDCIHQNPQSALDLNVLMSMLVERDKQGQQH